MEVIKKGDVVIIRLIVIVTIRGQYFLPNREIGGSQRIITVEIDQELYIYKLSFDDSKIIAFDFKDQQGALVYQDGKIRMETMNRDICPKQICSKTGWIEYKSQSIVCIPNKIIVTINGKQKRRST
jgi:hypothetical protein